MTSFGYFALASLPFLFVAFWLGICWFVSLNGWSPLSRYFRAEEAGSQAAATSYWMQSGTLRNLGSSGFGSRYRGSLTIRCGPAGLGLSVILLFRFSHPPLLVPWSAIGPVEKKPGFFGLIHYHSFPIYLPDGTNSVELRLQDHRVIEAISSYQQAGKLGQ